MKMTMLLIKDIYPISFFSAYVISIKAFSGIDIAANGSSCINLSFHLFPTLNATMLSNNQASIFFNFLACRAPI